MRLLSRFLSLAIAVSAFPATPASAETYEEYLARLRTVCEADCMQPREFQRTARKRDSDELTDMALIMDVAEVRRVGDAFELHSIDMETSALEDLAILGSAGVNTSSRNGIGGLPRSRDGGTSHNLIIVEMDEQTFYDILNVATPLVEGTVKVREGGEGSQIVVEGDRERVVVEPSLATLRAYFRNRRIVVRGQPRLAPVLVGARRDFRRKQVTLVVDDADEIVLLPRYDKNGDPVIDTR